MICALLMIYIEGCLRSIVSITVVTLFRSKSLFYSAYRRAVTSSEDANGVSKKHLRKSCSLFGLRVICTCLRNMVNACFLCPYLNNW